MQSATYIAATVGLQESPQARPYLALAAPVICAAAARGAAPGDLVGGLQPLPQTDGGYGALIVNGILPLVLAMFDNGDTNSYSAGLVGICNGLNLALSAGPPNPGSASVAVGRATSIDQPATQRYPHVRLRK